MLARACAFLILAGLTSAQDRPIAFEVATIKPALPERASRPLPRSPVSFTSRGNSLSALIQLAYDMRRDQVTGGPEWAHSDRWDVEAKTSAFSTQAEMKRMLQTLLADRFHLAFHRETKTAAVLALAIAKNGPKRNPQFHPAAEGETPPRGALRVDMKQLTNILPTTIWRWSAPGTAPDELPIVDATGLAGEYMVGLPLGQAQDWQAVLEDRLGLKLERRKMPVEVLVIDRAERPSEN